MSGENAYKKKALVEWTAECHQAFEQLKQLCSQTPVLAYANYQKPFKLHTDASEKGLGVVLYQKQDNGTDCMILYTSHTLSKSEKTVMFINYSSLLQNGLSLRDSISTCMVDILRCILITTH